jgi:hypothetical protein
MSDTPSLSTSGTKVWVVLEDCDSRFITSPVCSKTRTTILVYSFCVRTMLQKICAGAEVRCYRL